MSIGTRGEAGRVGLRDKTMDLLCAGYQVARLREYPLESLDIADDRYFETTVHATACALMR